MKTNRYIYLSLLELAIIIVMIPIIIYLIYSAIISNQPLKIIVDILDVTVRILVPTTCLMILYIFLQINNDFNYKQLKKCCNNL